MTDSRPPFPPFDPAGARREFLTAKWERERRILGPRPESEHGLDFPLR